MDLYEIGHICQYKYCGIRDFLPFFCERCNKYYCLKHKDYETHECNGVQLNLKLKPKYKKKTSRKYVCNHSDCKEKNIVEILCMSCNKHYCLKHRYKEIHKCHNVNYFKN